MNAYYYLDAGNQRQGPVDDNQLRQMVRDGRLSRESLVWAAGFKDWVPASQAPGLLPSAPPPLPKGPPSPPLDEPELADEGPRRRRRPLDEPEVLGPPSKFPIPLTPPVLIGAGVAAVLVLGMCIFFSVRMFGGRGGGGGGLFSGNVKPANLAGQWSGGLRIDASQLGEWAQMMPPGALNQAIPISVECTQDGKVRMGSGGVFVPYYIADGMQGRVLDGTTHDEGTTLKEFSSTADSVTFTVHERRHATRTEDIALVGHFRPGSGPVDRVMTVTLRRKGDAAELTMKVTDRNSTGPAVVLTGEVRKD